jgi:hypothetical protein
MAATTHAQTFMGGFGSDSCGRWTKERRDLGSPLTISMSAWVLGYLSGISLGYGKKDFLKGTDSEAVFGWIDKYCRENPLKTVAVAVVELALILRK